MAIAHCDAAGVIRISERRLPTGCLPIMIGRRRALNKLIEGNARLAYDGRTYLVPGVPEAPSQEAGLAALERFCDWLAKQSPRDVKVM